MKRDNSFFRLAAVMMGVALLINTPCKAAFHLWAIREIYTDASGSLQFIELFSSDSGEMFVGGQQVRVTDVGGTVSHTFTIPSNLPADTLNRALLLGTAGLDAAGGPTPDYIIPDNFLFPAGGTITFFGANSGSYAALPTDGILSRVWDDGNAVNSPQNFAGQVGGVGPVPPTITCPPNLGVQCLSDLPPCPTTLAEFLAVGGSVSVSPDAVLTFTCSDGPLTGGICGGTITRTHCVRDEAGNTACCPQTITVNDTIPPVITCPANLNVQCLSDVPPCPGSLAQFLAAGGTARDNCDNDLIYTCTDSPLIGGTCGGSILRTHCTVDDCVNTACCVQIITVNDTIPPVITCPADLNVQCLSDVPPCPGSLAQFLAGGGTARDNCDNDLIYTCADGPLIGGICGGRIFRTHCITDDCVNMACCVQVITINDTIPPVMTCAPDRTFEWVVGAVPVFANPNPSDNCDPNLLTTFADEELPAACPAVRVFRRTWTTIDDCLSPASCSQTVTFVDTTPPIILCPGDVTQGNDPGRCGAIVSFPDPTATDKSVPISAACNPPAGSFFPVGATTVTCTALDACNNPATCRFEVRVIDGEPVTISEVSADPAALWPPNHTMRDVAVAYTSGDNCATTCALSVRSSESPNGTGDGDTVAPDWEVVDDHHVRLRAERAATGSGRIYTITVTCTDAAGNSTSRDAAVVVAHNIKSPVSGAAFRVGTAVNFVGAFWDGPGRKHTAQWSFDNLTAPGTVVEPSGLKPGSVTGSYVFASPGVYKVRLDITDDRAVTSSVSTAGDLEAIVVIFDPSSGYTAGGGWISSPAGAYAGDPSLAGKVGFGFTSRYFKNATNPKGETQLEFKVGNLEFNALSFDYLAISGGKAQFKGFGKVNGVSGYNFILTVIDGQIRGGTDKLRIKIWNKNSGAVLYDNQRGSSDAADPVSAVGAGSSIVIQK